MILIEDLIVYNFDEHLEKKKLEFFLNFCIRKLSTLSERESALDRMLPGQSVHQQRVRISRPDSNVARGSNHD